MSVFMSSRAIVSGIRQQTFDSVDAGTISDEFAVKLELIESVVTFLHFSAHLCLVVSTIDVIFNNQTFAFSTFVLG